MKSKLWLALCALALIGSLPLSPAPAEAAPAIAVLGKDFAFPNRIDGLPARLSEFKGLEINSFTTDDNVRLAYWEAGKGDTIIFVPGWSANGAEYVNVMYLLARTHHVIVLDPRNQGLSQRVDYGMHIYRYSQDLKQLIDHLGVDKPVVAGWSMGASVIWGYIDLYGTGSLGKVVFVDEPISIVAHRDWSKEEVRDAGSFILSQDGTAATSPEQVIEAMGTMPNAAPDPSSRNLNDRFMLRDSPYFANSEAFANAFIKNDVEKMMLVMYDHASNDWRDVVRSKIDVPAAFFTGDYSYNVPSQKWAHSVVKGSKLFIYTKEEQGDHFLMFKNPIRFTTDLETFLAE